MPKETIAVIQETRETSDQPHSWLPDFQIFWWNQGEVTISMSKIPGGMDLNATRVIHSRRLSRDEINHAIRTLRRARDAAYGKDE